MTIDRAPSIISTGSGRSTGIDAARVAGFELFLVTRHDYRERFDVEPIPSPLQFLFEIVPIKIQSISSITVTLRGIIEDHRSQREIEERYSSRFVFISIGGKLEEEEEEGERAVDGGRDESGWEEKGKDQKGAEGAGEEGEGRQVVAIKSWTGPRRRKASVVAWVERGPVTSTISRFDRADRGKRRRGRRRRKRAW